MLVDSQYGAISKQSNTEYSAVLAPQTDGKWKIENVTKQSPTSGSISGLTVGGGELTWHSHADYSVPDAQGNSVPTSDPTKDQYNSDTFSGGGNGTGTGDIKSANDLYAFDPTHDRSYVSTPGGNVKEYDASNGQITTIKQGATDTSHPPTCGTSDLRNCR